VLISWVCAVGPDTVESLVDEDDERVALSKSERRYKFIFLVTCCNLYACMGVYSHLPFVMFFIPVGGGAV